MILAIGILVCLIACYFWVKLVFAIFRLISKRKTNPYISAQKEIIKNDKDYYDYLRWMSKKGSGVPLEKMKTIEEQNADQQINKLI